MNHVIHTPTDSVTEPRRARLSDPPYYGFPRPILDLLSTVDGLGPSSQCGLCGDAILGQRHRIIDAITERLLTGDGDAGDDWDVHPWDLGVIVAAHYEHDKALRRRRRAVG